MNAITLNEVFQLPAQERLRIASALWDSAADQPDAFHLTAWQEAELDSRYADYLANPGAGEPWQTVKLQIQRLG